MNVYIEAPTAYAGGLPGIFLAGGITGCPDWQAAACELLSDLPVALFNPRRENFPITDPSASREQIAWEYAHLRAARAILFWFPNSGPVTQPIALYELGHHAALLRPIAVGADPAYIRRADIRIQMSLSRPDITVRSTLEETCADIRDLLKAGHVEV